MARDVAAAGYAGYVDRFGYEDIVSRNGRLSFFELRG
jgi:hypothetical protein